ncbi:MAG: hypothetical protein WC655_09300 [Candidatus Hydrogenedentales bacterium]
MGPDIYSRLKDCLERQIAAYELMLNEYPEVDEAAEERELDDILSQQTAWTAQTRDLEQEFHILLREWQRANDVSEAQRAEIESLSLRMEEFAARLIAMNDKVVARIDARLKVVGQELGQVRKGRIDMSRYRAGDDEPGYMDRHI